MEVVQVIAKQANFSHQTHPEKEDLGSFHLISLDFLRICNPAYQIWLVFTLLVKRSEK